MLTQQELNEAILRNEWHIYGAYDRGANAITNVKWIAAPHEELARHIAESMNWEWRNATYIAQYDEQEMIAKRYELIDAWWEP